MDKMMEKADHAKKFVNQYDYNEELVIEAQNAYYYNSINWKKTIIILIVFGLYSVGVTIYFKNPWYLLLLLIIPFLLMLASGGRKRLIKNEMDRIRTLNDGENHISVKYCIDGAIKVGSNEKENDRTISLSSVDKYYETKNLMILMLKGRIIVPFKKGAFLEGNEDEFRVFAKELTKCNKKNKGK